MITGFKNRFEPRILDGSKIHTLREDIKSRWRLGMMMHMAVNVRTKKMRIFKTEPCISTQAVVLILHHNELQVMVDNRLLKGDEIEQFARNDGFDNLAEMKTFFLPTLKPHHFYDGILHLKLLHWTDFKYEGV